MSNWTNKHIPSDLDSMTAKDFRELVLIQIEHGQADQKEITRLQAEVERLNNCLKASSNDVENLLYNGASSRQRAEAAEQRAEQLQRERDELERSMVKVECECIDVLFDFAADRDSRGIVLPLCDQSSPIAEAMRVADEQLRKGGGDND